MSNAEFTVSPMNINFQLIEIRLPDHMNYSKKFTPIQATQVLTKKGMQEKIKKVFLNSPHTNCTISQPATNTYERFDVSNDPNSTVEEWNRRITNLVLTIENRVQLVIEVMHDIDLLQLIPTFSTNNKVNTLNLQQLVIGGMTILTNKHGVPSKNISGKSHMEHTKAPMSLQGYSPKYRAYTIMSIMALLQYSGIGSSMIMCSRTTNP